MCWAAAARRRLEDLSAATTPGAVSLDLALLARTPGCLCGLFCPGLMNVTGGGVWEGGGVRAGGVMWCGCTFLLRASPGTADAPEQRPQQGPSAYLQNPAVVIDRGAGSGSVWIEMIEHVVPSVSTLFKVEP